VCPKGWPRATCPLCGQTESQRNSVHQAWWHWSRCGQSAAQRSVLPVVALAEMGGAAEVVRVPQRLATRHVPALRADRVAAQLCPPSLVALVALRPVRRPAKRPARRSLGGDGRGGGSRSHAPRHLHAPDARCAGRQSRSATLSTKPGGTGRAATSPPASVAQGRRNHSRAQSMAMSHVPAMRADRVAAQLCPPSLPSLVGALGNYLVIMV
jgi:hypothetical protein